MLQMPQAWRTDGPATVQAVRAQWWKGFNDPVLDALVDNALTRNTDLRTARSRVLDYQARISVAGAAQLPSLSGSIGPTRTRSLGAGGAPSEVTVYQGTLQASYEADLWGKLESLTEAALADLAAQRALADATALLVAANTVTGYLNLRGLDAQLQLARATLQSREQSLNLAQRQFEVGYSSRLEWVQAQSEYRATAAAIPQLERSIAQQENALTNLSGANPGPVTRGPVNQQVLPPPAPGLPSELLRRRPDILQAERAVVSADASLASARDQLLPSIRLTASAGIEAFSLSQLLQSPYTLWSIGGSVLAPVFDGGRLRAQTDIAATVRDRAIFAYEGAVRNAFAETENGLVAVQKLQEQVTQSQARETYAAETLRIATNRYRNGYASYLEELDAQRTLYSAQVSLLQLRTSLQVAQVDLYRALGGGWDAADTGYAASRHSVPSR